MSRLAWTWAWAAVGFVAALGAVSLGPLVSIPALVAVVFMSRSRSARGGAFGLLVGVGLLLLFVAWVQRHGPGNGDLNPLPWLVLGVLLVLGGAVAQHVRAR